MNPHINQFFNSHFSHQKKRNIFFPARPRVCHNCHLPKTKKKIDFGQFSLLHQGLISICAQGGAGGAGHGEVTNFVDQQQFNAFQINIQNQLNQLNLFQQQILQTLANIQIRLHALDGQ